MDYVEGESLSVIQQVLRHRGARMPLGIALKILDDVLSGLHAAHELRGDDGAPLCVVHRDVTPHNILVGVDGVSRLTDFGVAKAQARLTKTSPGLVKGKIAYMSPEQAQGKTLDRRVDVWAVGVVAWEAFSGSRMHDGTNDPVLMLKIARDPPMRLRHVRPELPRELDAVLASALAMDPRSRSPTAEALADAFRDAAARAAVSPADAREVRDFLLDSSWVPARGPSGQGGRNSRPPAALGGSLGGRAGSAPPATARVGAAARPPLVEQLEATVAHGPVLPARALRGPSRLGGLLTTILTAPLKSRAWVVASILPAVALALAYVVASDGTPRVTRAVSLSGATPSASVPPPAQSASVPPPAQSANVLPPTSSERVPRRQIWRYFPGRRRARRGRRDQSFRAGHRASPRCSGASCPGTPATEATLMAETPYLSALSSGLERLERVLLRVWQLLSLLGIVTGLAYGVLVSRPLGFACALGSSLFLIWFVLAGHLADRGEAPRSLAGINAAVEALVPWAFMLAISVSKGAEYALASWVPPFLFCSCIVTHVARLRLWAPAVLGLSGAVAYPSILLAVHRGASAADRARVPDQPTFDSTRAGRDTRHLWTGGHIPGDGAPRGGDRRRKGRPRARAGR